MHNYTPSHGFILFQMFKNVNCSIIFKYAKKQPFIHLNLFDSIFNYAYTENNKIAKKMLPLTKSSLKSNTHQNVYSYEVFCYNIDLKNLGVHIQKQRSLKHLR